MKQLNDRRSCEDHGKAKQVHASIFKRYVLISLKHFLLIEIRAIFNYSRSIIQTCLLNSAFITLLTLRLHSTEQYIHKHNTNFIIQYTHRKITQCKLHAGMRPYIHNKYFN